MEYWSGEMESLSNFFYSFPVKSQLTLFHILH